ncbi:CutC family protein [Chytriomyces sp. MP71]|nr:CutC family protein [Chytriomyces sp. MP71]
MPLALEVCVESVESALVAQNNGAARIELCASLAVEGGITPSLGLISLAKQRVSLPIMVMIRPRSGDFCYSDDEFDIMKTNIEACKSAGVAGVVFGILTPEGRVDIDRMKTLVFLAQPLQVTFHRAFDVTRDTSEALTDILSLGGGIQRILTSGADKSVLEGLPMLETLFRQANGRVIIMPGAGISLRNLDRIMSALIPAGLQEIHMSCMKTVDSPMIYRNSIVSMGSSAGRSEFQRVTVNGDTVRQVVDMFQTR